MAIVRPHRGGSRRVRSRSATNEGSQAALRLVRPPSSANLPGKQPATPTPTQGQPIRGNDDPRWVLAVRTAERLEGATLRPERRERLLQLGKVMGLSPFDASLIIAIVQDQARRGHLPDYCPTAGEPQLRMVPLPTHATLLTYLRKQPAIATSLVVAGLLALELLLIRWLF